MIVKKATYKKVRKLVEVEVKPEQYACDTCRGHIDYNENLHLSVWPDHSSNSTDHHFCSWKCCFEFIPKIKSTYFVSLPYLHYDEKHAGMRAIDFIALISPKSKAYVKKKKSTKHQR